MNCAKNPNLDYKHRFYNPRLYYYIPWWAVGFRHWIRSQWCFCCVSNHAKYLNLHPFFFCLIDIWSVNLRMVWISRDVWSHLCATGRDTLHIRERQILHSWAQTCSVTWSCPCPSLPSWWHTDMTRRLPRLQPCSSRWYRPSHWLWLPR